MFAYHATTEAAVGKIVLRGLRPREQPLRRDGHTVTGSVLYFCQTEELAREWGPAIVRFPWPDDATKQADGSFYSRLPVPQEFIQISRGGVWLPAQPCPSPTSVGITSVGAGTYAVLVDGRRLRISPRTLNNAESIVERMHGPGYCHHDWISLRIGEMMCRRCGCQRFDLTPKSD